MIKIGIDGAGSPEAGELIRLLINHPDVVLEQVWQSDLAGRSISDVHHGLVGEKELTITQMPDYKNLDIIFYTSSAADLSLSGSDDFISLKKSQESGFAIYVDPSDDMLDEGAPFYLRCKEDAEVSSDDSEEANEPEDWDDTIVFGVPELNRKPLVRGARKVVIPTAVESMVAVALLPLQGYASVSGHMEISVKGAPEIIADYRSSRIRIEDRLGKMLTTIFGEEVKVSLRLKEDDSTPRCLSIAVNIPATSTLDVMRKAVTQVYDDHHLAHLSYKPLAYKEVEGTDNCLIGISNIGAGLFRVEAIADARMRGGAGEAVHIMNLFAGLFEKTGLHLKASNF